MKSFKTYIVRLTSNSCYGTNQDYYYRTEAAAKTQAADLRRWYGENTSQNIQIITINEEG
jgi:hypothetical protein